MLYKCLILKGHDKTVEKFMKKHFLILLSGHYFEHLEIIIYQVLHYWWELY